MSRKRSFCCPCCLAVSHQEEDFAAGYCGRCHDWTGDPDVMMRRLSAAFHDAAAGQAEHIPPYAVSVGPHREFVCHMAPELSPLDRHLVAGDVRRRTELGIGFEGARLGT